MLQRIVDFFRQPAPPEPAPVEQRAAESEGGYAHTVLSGWDAYYGTQQADATQTAAVEIALGMIYRAFLLAVPTVEAPMLTPQVLGMMACQAIGRGNSVWEITLEGRTFGLMPAADFTVSGNISPTTWRYTMDFYAPGQYDPIKRNVAGEGVVHARYKPSPFAPWLGISPLVSAKLSASVLARIERSIRDDASIPTGVLMPSPDGATVDQTNTLSSAMAGGRGGITALETMKAGLGARARASPDEDFEQKRFGPTFQQLQLGSGTRQRWPLSKHAVCLLPCLHRRVGRNGSPTASSLLERFWVLAS